MKVIDIINEEILKFEGVGDKYAEKFGMVGNDDYMDSQISKNPQTLIDVVPDTRAITDSNGNLYVSVKNQLTHGQMAEEVKLVNQDEFHYEKGRILSLFRIGNTNSFGLNIYSFKYMTRPNFNDDKKKILNLLNLARRKNPQFKFLAELYDAEGEGENWED